MIVSKLNLSVRLKGEPNMSSVTTVVVTLLDVNDNPPEFERTVYTMSVDESAAIGAAVGRVFATSRDTGINAEMAYSIVGPNGHEFAIDPVTGKLDLLGFGFAFLL